MSVQPNEQPAANNVISISGHLNRAARPELSDAQKYNDAVIAQLAQKEVDIILAFGP